MSAESKAPGGVPLADQLCGEAEWLRNLTQTDVTWLRNRLAITADLIDEARAALAAQPQAAPVAWCQLAIDGRHIAYFDGKPMVMPGPVGNDCHPHPLYVGAPPAQCAAEGGRASADDWVRAIAPLMPADFKDWHENNPREWPAVTAEVIAALRESEAFWLAQAYKVHPKAPNLACPSVQARLAAQWGYVPAREGE